MLLNNTLRIVGLLIIGIAIGYGLSLLLPASPEKDFSLSESRSGGYRFVNPLLECDDFNSEGEIAMASIRHEVNKYINEVKKDSIISHVSLYFRSLNNGAHFGIEQNERYAPASLLKVTYLLMALKKAEMTPGFLQQKMVFEQKKDSYVPNILDTGLIVLGNTYTIDELLYKMIVHSDNEARLMVASHFPDDEIFRLLAELGLVIPDVVNDNEIMSVREYSTFFRVLYNATYLNREMSEKALAILSNTTFYSGIVSGVPTGTIVAHKFGERGFEGTNMVQLHDCGIVYANNNPYLICVMTRGTDFREMSRAIANISAIVYKEVVK